VTSCASAHQGLGNSHFATTIAIGAITRRLPRPHAAPSSCPTAAQAEALGERKPLIQRLTEIDLLAIDSSCMKKLGPSAAEYQLEVFIRRHEAASTIVTANRPT
jgi:hypothetical protein